MAKVLLITPPYHCGVVESSGNWLPLGLTYIAGHLRKAGHNVEIYDAMSKYHTHDQIRRKIEDCLPDVVMVTAMTPTYVDAVTVLKNAKKIDNGMITVLGGIHPTFMYEEILKTTDCVDFVVIGEGEITSVELLKAVENNEDLKEVKGIAYLQNGEIHKTPVRHFIHNIDSLTPAWDLLDWQDYKYFPKNNSVFAVVSSSRGCIQSCSFCSQQKFWNKTWRGRSAESFAAELEMLNRVYGVDIAVLTDELPTRDRNRWERILDLIIEKNLNIELLIETRVDDIIRDEDIIDKYAKAGIVHIYVGVESISQETLDYFNKGIKVEQSKKAIDIINGAGILSETSFVIGMPDDTKETIDKTVELAKYYNPDLAFFLVICPWPYSDIYKQLEPYIEDRDYRNYNLVKPIVRTNSMTRNRLTMELFRAFGQFYLFKMSQIHKMDAHKREYMIKVSKLLMQNSYLGKKMKEVFKKVDHAKKTATKYIGSFIGNF